VAIGNCRPLPAKSNARAMVNILLPAHLLCRCTQTSKWIAIKQYSVSPVVLFDKCDKSVTVVHEGGDLAQNRQMLENEL
jgi:hypothetical protein